MRVSPDEGNADAEIAPPAVAVWRPTALLLGAAALTGGVFCGLGFVLGLPVLAALGAGLLLGVAALARGARNKLLVAGLCLLGAGMGWWDGGHLLARLKWMEGFGPPRQVRVWGTVSQRWLGEDGEVRLRLHLAPGAARALTRAGQSPQPATALAGTTVGLSARKGLLDGAQPGQRWRFAGRFHPPGPPFGLSPYHPRWAAAARGEAGWLRASQAHATPALSGVNSFLWAMRHALLRRLDARFSPAASALVASLVLGARAPGLQTLAEDLRQSGALHLLVVSGAHLGLITAGIWLGLKGLKVGWWRRLWAVALALLVYSFMAGGVALLRAAVMGALVVAGRFAGQGVRPQAALSLAVLVMVGADSLVVFSPGFWLSVAATAGVLLGLATRRVVAQEHPWLNHLALGLWTGLWAMTFTLPFLAGFFGQAAVLSPLSSLLLLPVMSALLALGLLALGVGTWLPGAAVVLDFLITGLGRVAQAQAAWLARWPGAAWRFSLAEALCLSAAVLCVLVWWVWRNGEKARQDAEPAAPKTAPAATSQRPAALLPGAALALATVVAVWPAFFPTAALTVDFLNVGQGDATLLTGPSIGAVLVDGGPWPVDAPPASAPVVQSLGRRGVRRLSLMVATHGDADHTGGLVAALGSLAVDAVALGQADGRFTRPDSLTLQALDRRLAGKQVKRLKAGDVLQSGALSLKVLSPGPGQRCRGNACALVLLAQMGKLRLLLPSDAPLNDAWLRQQHLAGALPPVHVALLPHHGGKRDSGGLLWWRTRPALVVMSAGLANPHGHPSPQARQRLAYFRLPWLATFRHGTVTLTGDPNGHLRVFTRP